MNVDVLTRLRIFKFESIPEIIFLAGISRIQKMSYKIFVFLLSKFSKLHVTKTNPLKVDYIFDKNGISNFLSSETSLHSHEIHIINELLKKKIMNLYYFKFFVISSLKFFHISINFVFLLIALHFVFEVLAHKLF